VRIISIKHLKDFWILHPQSEQALKAWHAEAKIAIWSTPQDIKNRYPNASFIGSNRVVFNIKGNHYRLIIAMAYRFGAVYIKFVGTHAAYNAVDAGTVEME